MNETRKKENRKGEGGEIRSSKALVEALVEKGKNLGIDEGIGTQHILERLVDDGLLEGEEALDMVDTLFSAYQLTHRETMPADVDLAKLLDSFKKSESCMEIAFSCGKMYKIDLASIQVESERSEDQRWVTASRCQVLLSQSFSRLRDTSKCEGGDPVGLWCRYFIKSLELCEHVPSSLLSFCARDESTARRVTDRVSSMRGKRSGTPWESGCVRRRLPVFTEQVIREILAAWPDDTAACFALANALGDQRRFHEARVVLRVRAGHPSAEAAEVCNLRCRIAGLYGQEIAALRKSGAPCSAASETEEKARKEYEGLVRYARENGVPCDGFLQTFGTFEKDHHAAHHAIEIAGEIRDDRRRNLLLGMTYNSFALKTECPEIYDPERAVGHYLSAWEALMLEKGPSRTLKMGILYPLASALHDSGRDDESIEICRYALSVKEERKVRNLLRFMGVAGAEGVEAIADIPELLKRRNPSAAYVGEEPTDRHGDEEADSREETAPALERRGFKVGILRAFGLDFRASA